MSEGDGINLGVQWGSLETGAMIQYPNSGAPIGQVLVGLEEAKDQTTTEERYNSVTGRYENVPVTESGSYDTLASALGGVNGAALSVVMGDWTALISAVSSDTQSNILSSPSITVVDNEERNLSLVKSSGNNRFADSLTTTTHSKRSNVKTLAFS